MEKFRFIMFSMEWVGGFFFQFEESENGSAEVDGQFKHHYRYGQGSVIFFLRWDVIDSEM